MSHQKNKTTKRISALWLGLLALTCFEYFQVAKFQKIISIVEVGDINFIIVRHRVLHPRSFIPAICVVSYWL